ncbi:MAG: thioredoxin family protein [bacterium]
MNKTSKAIVLTLLVLVLAGGIFIKNRMRASTPAATPAPTSTTLNVLPVLYEFGAGMCVQCKNMAPIIEELSREYQGVLEVRKVDVNENSQAVEKYKVQFIPCQVLLDRDGKEIFRHVGFIEKKALIKVLSGKGVKPLGN